MAIRKILLATVFSVAAALPAHAATVLKEEYEDFESAELVPYTASDSNAYSADTAVTYSSSGGNSVFTGFEAVSQYDVASFARNFIPPDTMGAVGRTQYVSFVNGGFGVFDKNTGATVLKTSDLTFWANAGQTGANGDSRVLFDNNTNRWVALSFGSSVADIQIAVSDTDNAAGAWHSTKFTGFNIGNGSIADYPTLAKDGSAIYIGTNDFNIGAGCGGGQFCGTTLNVIPLSNIFAAGGPTTTDITQFYTPFPGSFEDRGFAIQGVNSNSVGAGKVVAASLFFNDTLTYNVNFTGDKATSTGNVQYYGTENYDGNGPGRQPNQTPDVFSGDANFPNNDRVIDTLDQRISSSVYEVNGKIYSVYTATPVGADYTYVHYVITDANTNAILDEGNIGDGAHDYYQGSLAVNDRGQVVIAYNRSGSEADTGNITFAALVFSTNNGKLVQRGDELVLKVSLVDDYHNGSTDGFTARGRQRWGDYSACSLDPDDQYKFYCIGEYAREYNNAAGGHPGGTGGSRWSTWVSGIQISGVVPEPSTWAMMIGGFGLVGGAARRRVRRVSVNFA